MKKFKIYVLTLLLLLSMCLISCGDKNNLTTKTEIDESKTDESATEEQTTAVYKYTINYTTESFKSYARKNSNSSINIVEVSNIKCSYDKYENPTDITVSFLVTKIYQASRLGAMDSYTEKNTIYVTLHDINGNQIGQKEVVTTLAEKGDSKTYSTYFQVEPGTYTVKLTGSP